MKSGTEKKPVLTSPWKIGLFVSLMLIVVSFGVGYYLVNEYNIDLKWLSTASRSWKIDSFLFFREIYPLLSGVVILALFSYFIIASAVRRYKSFLDSGQDYRKMVSLAESIDDLTNPTQIARLSNYPELQNVLRNYGDQIREISAEIENEKDSNDIYEFETAVRSVISDEAVDTGSTQNKWWSAIFNEIKDDVSRRRKSIDDLKKKRDNSRMIAGKAALQSGRVKEEVKRISEAVAKMRGALVGMRSGLGDTSNTKSASVQSDSGDRGVWLSDMEMAIQKLKEIGSNFGDFANQNNNLALNVALLAAKGKSAENELANCAEKIRVSAEGFNQLSKHIIEISDQLMSSFFAVKEGNRSVPISQSTMGSASVNSDAVGRLLDSIGNVEKEASEIIGELDELEVMLQEEVRNTSYEEASEQTLSAPAPKESERNETLKEVSDILKSEFVSRNSDEGNDDLAFDRQQEWGSEGMLDLDNNFNTPVGSVKEGGMNEKAEISSDETSAVDEHHDFAGETTLSMDDAEPSPGLDGIDTGEESKNEQTEINEDKNDTSGESGESWMEMPGHRWVKIDVEDKPIETREKNTDVEVENTANKTNSAFGDPGVSTKQEQTQKADSKAPETRHLESDSVEEETVYDLFELGAVEYVEQSEQKL